MEKRLNKIRKSFGLTQQEFAEKTGLARRTVQMYEKDTSSLTISKAHEIARLFNVNIDWLLTGIGEMLSDVTKDVSAKHDPKHIVNEGPKNDDILKHFKNYEKVRRLNEKLLKLEYISESQLDRVEGEIDKLLEIAEDVAYDIKKTEEAHWQKDKEQKKEAIMATMGKGQRRKKAAG